MGRCIGRDDALSDFTADAEGFDAFYQRSARPILRQLYAMVGDGEEAPAPARGSLYPGLATAGPAASYDDPAAWVRTTVWRIAVSRWRQARRPCATPDVDTPQLDAIELVADLVSLSTALGKLPARQREALGLPSLSGRPLDR